MQENGSGLIFQKYKEISTELGTASRGLHKAQLHGEVTPTFTRISTLLMQPRFRTQSWYEKQSTRTKSSVGFYHSEFTEDLNFCG